MLLVGFTICLLNCSLAGCLDESKMISCVMRGPICDGEPFCFSFIFHGDHLIGELCLINVILRVIFFRVMPRVLDIMEFVRGSPLWDGLGLGL